MRGEAARVHEETRRVLKLVVFSGMGSHFTDQHRAEHCDMS